MLIDPLLSSCAFSNFGYTTGTNAAISLLQSVSNVIVRKVTCILTCRFSERRLVFVALLIFPTDHLRFKGEAEDVREKVCKTPSAVSDSSSKQKPRRSCNQ